MTSEPRLPTVLGFDPNDPALSSLPTPSLLLDLDALDRNLERMNGYLEEHGRFARPHTKTHKSPQIAQRQLSQSRTVGICCARISEAEAMVAAGIDKVLVTSPITTAEKIERFVALSTAAGSGIWTVVDGDLGVRRLADEAQRQATTCNVIIDLDPGFHRTGVTMGAPAVALAQLVASRPSLVLRGLQMYAGTLMHLEDAVERRTKAAALWDQAVATADAIKAAGIPCDVLTGGGTGTFNIDADLGTASDQQVGSYVFMDAQYRVIENSLSAGEQAPFDYFEPSLFVLASAVSQSVPQLITVDAGFKALACDHIPEIAQFPGMRFHFGGDEHGMIEVHEQTDAIQLGDRVVLLVSHCDPTVNLHQHYVTLRDGNIAGTWEIAARGVA